MKTMAGLCPEPRSLAGFGTQPAATARLTAKHRARKPPGAHLLLRGTDLGDEAADLAG